MMEVLAITKASVICGFGILLSEGVAILKEMRKSVIGLSIYLLCENLISFSLFISTVNPQRD